jgi:hypothetical protein
MPCYRCGVRQTDPVRGASPWRRGVCAGAQVLVCPVCQGAHDWAEELDRCGRCGSTMLVRSLGETQCRSCGLVAEPVPGVLRGRADRAQDGRPTERVADESGRVPGLSEDVAAALDRLFGQHRQDPRVDHPAGRAAGHRGGS